MPAEVRVEPVSEPQLERLLPLIAAYQRFYAVEGIDTERNRAFFSRFLAPSEDGMLLGAWSDEELTGYACLYWHFTSLVPAETVLMNDLFVEQGQRGYGIGPRPAGDRDDDGRSDNGERSERVVADLEERRTQVEVDFATAPQHNQGSQVAR